MSRVWHIVHNPALQNKRAADEGPPAATRRPPAVGRHQPPFAGADLWSAWHRRALSWAGGDDTSWVNAHILTKLPCGDCSRHAKAFLVANPPAWSPGHYFTWTVIFHNAVNLRLGRPLWTIDQAREVWSAAPLQSTDSTLAKPVPAPVP